jgi:hypothetical protein
MEKKIAIVVEPDGNWSELEFTNSTALDVFQKAVGGLIQPVDIDAGEESITIYVNEEGLLYHLPENALATNVASAYFAEKLSDETYIMTLVGNAVFVGQPDEEGYTQGLTEDQRAIVKLGAGLQKLAHSLSTSF